MSSDSHHNIPTFKPIGEVLQTALDNTTTNNDSNTQESHSSSHNHEHTSNENTEEYEETEQSSSSKNKITYEAGGEITVLNSLCMACGDQGKTRLLLTRIPFFRDVIIMAFECEVCGFRNSEIQPAEVQEKGCRFEVKVNTLKDFNRQMVKGDKATIIIPDLDFEIPAITQAGVFTTIEGLLDRAIENLQNSQIIRRNIDPEGAQAVDAFLDRLRNLREGNQLPFTLILDDPSGNSFIENPNAPKSDPSMRVRFYTRTDEQNSALGLAAANARLEGGAAQYDEDGNQLETVTETNENEETNETNNNNSSSSSSSTTEPVYEEGDSTQITGSTATTVFPNHKADVDTAAAVYQEGVKNMRAKIHDMSGNVPGGFKKGGALINRATDRASLTNSSRRAGAVHDASGRLAGLIFDSSSSDATKEVLTFPQDCFNCSAKGEVRMCVTDVPHFKEVILMSFSCDECGWKNVEVKGGGAVPPKGTIHELQYIPNTDHSEEDMIRDVIKGDTASVEIPELDIELQPGTLGGMYTTVEGLLTAIKDRLLESNPFTSEAIDSGDSSRTSRMNEVTEKLEACQHGKIPFTLRIRDAMANTWIYSPYSSVVGEMDGRSNLATTDGGDPYLTVLHYTRTEDEDLELGLLDMNAPRDDDDDEEEENKDNTNITSSTN